MGGDPMGEGISGCRYPMGGVGGCPRRGGPMVWGIPHGCMGDPRVDPKGGRVARRGVQWVMGSHRGS